MRSRETRHRLSAVALVVAIAIVPRVCPAQEPPPPNPQPSSRVGEPVPPPNQPPAPPQAAPSKPADSMDFDLFGDDKAKTTPQGTGADLTNKKIPQDPERLAKMIKRRRLMLQLHQGFGFATLATLAATVVIGQLNYVDKYGGGNFTNRYATPHAALAGASAALFATDASLALFAPTPYRKPIKADAALAHKVLMGMAAAGFIAELILGPITAAKGGSLNQKNLALGHVVTGYVTFASMLGGYLSYVF